MGNVRSGSFASPAVTPTSSTPTKANITICRATSVPPKPFGNSPPWSHRFSTDALSPRGPSRNARTALPMMITATTVTTLISASQNSTSPNSATETRLTRVQHDGDHERGDPLRMSGNQYCT